MRVIENKNMQADLTRIRVESTRMRVVGKNHNNYNKKKNKKLSMGLVPVNPSLCVLR
jgi:hypothetical protein